MEEQKAEKIVSTLRRQIPVFPFLPRRVSAHPWASKLLPPSLFSLSFFRAVLPTPIAKRLLLPRV